MVAIVWCQADLLHAAVVGRFHLTTVVANCGRKQSVSDFEGEVRPPKSDRVVYAESPMVLCQNAVVNRVGGRCVAVQWVCVPCAGGALRRNSQ
jgi:hypothetical protein